MSNNVLPPASPFDPGCGSFFGSGGYEFRERVVGEYFIAYADYLRAVRGGVCDVRSGCLSCKLYEGESGGYSGGVDQVATGVDEAGLSFEPCSDLRGGRYANTGKSNISGSVVGSSGELVGGGAHVLGSEGFLGGPNLERNRENRRLKRERKLKRQSMNQDWRKRDKSTVDSGVSVGGNQGFWNSCSPEVRQQLIDSKAEWHIAENKRRAREEVAKLEKSTSVQAVVKQVLDTVKLANELKKNTKDEKIGGWAETVADSLNKSVAESVPSSLPSLESVGYGEAAIGRGGLSTPQTSNSEYDEVCQKLADKESICEKLNLRINELETKQLVSDGEMKKVLENEKNVEKRLFEAEIDKIKLRHYSSDIFCDDFLQRDIDMFTRDYKKKQQQKKKNKGS